MQTKLVMLTRLLRWTTATRWRVCWLRL